MDGGGELIRRLRIHLHRIGPIFTKQLAGPFGGEARELRQAIHSAESLNIFIENLIDSRRTCVGRSRYDDVGRDDYWLAIDGVDGRRHSRVGSAAMASPARYHLAST